MKREKLNEYKKRLLQLKEKLLHDIGAIEEEHIRHSAIIESGDTYYPQHAADISDNEFKAETGFKIKENEEKLLEEINEALDRIDEGSYGICTDCGMLIKKKRLEAMPCAIRCIDCKSKYEKEVKSY